MKLKISHLLLGLMALITFSASAQTAKIIPSKFTAEDEITVEVNVTGYLPLDGVEPLYFWGFCNKDLPNSGNALTNGEWEASSEQAIMTKVAPNVWQYKFKATTLFGKSPSELKTLGFLVKAKSGAGNPEKKTGDFLGYKFDPLVFSESQFRSFPSKASASDVITIYMTNSYAPTDAIKRMTVTGVGITAFTETDEQVGAAVEKPVDGFTAGVASFAFIPAKLFTPQAGVKIAKLKFQFTGKGLSAEGTEVDVTANEGEVTLLDF